MLKLFKNVVRSFKNNKLSIIGLSFLVLLSTGIYTMLSGTTSAINKEYNYISEEGNLHDFIVSELYSIGTIKYNGNFEHVVDTRQDPQVSYESCLYDDNALSWTSDGVLVPYVYLTGTPEAATVTVRYSADISELENKSSLKNFYLDAWIQHLNDPSPSDLWNTYNGILEPTASFTGLDLSKQSQKIEAFNYFSSEDQKVYGKDHEKELSTKTFDEYSALFAGLDISAKISNLIEQSSNDLYSLVSQESTLMNKYLDTLHSVSGYRSFNSLNIDNSPDNIFYKVIKSNPEDEIDKFVQISPNNGSNPTKWNNFDVRDCTYSVLDYANNDNWGLNETLKYLPSAIGDDFDIHYIEKIYLLNKGDWTSTPGPFKKKIISLIDSSPLPTTADERQDWWNNKKSALTSLLKDEIKASEQVYTKDYRVTIQWTGLSGNPSAWSITNWTAQFATVTPEFMNKNNLHTLDPNSYNQVDSYKQYVIDHPEITDQKMLFIGWLNSLSYPDYSQWFTSVANPTSPYKDQFICPGGGAYYLIIGSGITPDFIYPIVSIEKSTPNPNKECIYFTNTAGYGLIFDSFRGNLTENYIVGKFLYNNRGQCQKVLDDINEYAREVMIYPEGINAAYFAGDTTNVLNASAFRISYIPKFINAINITSISLTLFIILLSLVICAIVIHRYITNQQSILGIMKANGISNAKIATSILPIAIIPALFGTIFGAIIGTLLQLPVLGLFSNYWMLPTQLLGFNWLGFFAILLITLVIFAATIYITSSSVLRKNTVDLMKNDSQDSPKLASRGMKRVFGRFGILTKFRVAVAFNSIWKLIVLVIMTSLSLSTLVFTLSINGKFKNATYSTNISRNYKYAVDLYSPTNQGGQYNAVNYGLQDPLKPSSKTAFQMAGTSGFNQAGNDPRDVNYLQSLYYGAPESVKDFPNPIIPWSSYDLNLPSITYSDNNKYSSVQSKGYLPEIQDDDGAKHALNYFLNRKYYYSSYVGNYMNIKASPTADEINSYMNLYQQHLKFNDSIFSNLFIPFMGDSMGQQADIFYLKDRVMTNSTLDYVVGIPSIQSNPWDISASLMPENNKKMLERAKLNFIDFIGRAIYYEDGVSDPKYQDLHGLFVAETGDPELENYKQFIHGTDPSSPKLPPYEIDKTKVVGTIAVALNADFINLLSTAYGYEETAKLDYYVTYNVAPLTKTDETYTWVSGNVLKDNSSAKIIGIKTGDYASKYVNLYDENKINLNDPKTGVIRYAQSDFERDYKNADGSWNYNFDKPFPIIVNAYAAHKYNLKIGSHISFDITNKADRFVQKMNPSKAYNNVANFEVKGVCTTYEGQEYFIDQDVANLLLGLKTHLWDGELDQNGNYIQSMFEPSQFYGYNYDSIENVINGTISDSNKQGIKVKAGDKMLFDLKDYEKDLYEYNQINNTNYNLTSYGFNGIFTDQLDGSAVLSKGIILYSPTGLYPGNDRMTSEVTKNVISYGANLEIFRRVTLCDDTDSDLAKGIQNAYNEWFEAGDDEKKAKHDALDLYATDAINFIHEYFGDQAYCLIINGATDATAMQLVFDNLSGTISNLTYAIIGVVSLMVIIIVALITNMVINDSKRLAALLKALGYTDGENATSFLSIYIPVIIFGLGIAALLSWGLVAAYNSLVFNSMNIWLNVNIKWYNYFIALAGVGAVFAISAANSVWSLKRSSLVDSIK